ncbi:MAG: YihY family inner membrane protein [Rhodospirillales bacterium]|nr:YihY family inner membrane protein [Rhodospirillales bacterium]
MSDSRQQYLSGHLRSLKPFLAYVWQRFTDDRCWRMAAGLSYTSLLAIVPLSAIAFSMLAAFPVFEGVKEKFQDALFDNLLPQSAAAMQEYFNTFVSNTTGLSAVGIVALAVTAVLLMGTIEADLNTIFRVKKARAVVPRLLVFWAMLTLGPLLLGASFSLSTYFFAATEWLGVDIFSGSLGLLTKSLPTVIIVFLLGLFYLAIPNRPVGPRAACIGGLTAGVLFAGLRQVFGWYVATFPTYQNIYGALSVVPIFLVWMYLSWTVVLLGAVLTSSLSEWQNAGGKPVNRTLHAGPRLMVALRILVLLYLVSRVGGNVTRRRMLGEIGCSEEAAEQVLELLQGGGFAQRLDGGGWILGRDLSTSTLYDLYQALHLGLRDEDIDEVTENQQDNWQSRLARQLKNLQSAQISATSILLSDLVAGTDRKG